MEIVKVTCKRMKAPRINNARGFYSSKSRVCSMDHYIISIISYSARPFLLNHPFKILIIGGSISEKTNVLLNLIKEQDSDNLIDKI